MPTAVPMMAASASGLSMTRWEPNLRCRSSVTRKTPPSTPTSSPRISTSRSRSISWKSPRLRALTMFSLGMASPSRQPLAPHRRGARGCLPRLAGVRRGGRRLRGHLGPLGLEVRRQLGIHVVEHRERIGGRGPLQGTPPLGGVPLGPPLQAPPPQNPLFPPPAGPRPGGLLLPHRGLFRGPAPVLV